jgi:hypothetical protein
MWTAANQAHHSNKLEDFVTNLTGSLLGRWKDLH